MPVSDNHHLKNYTISQLARDAGVSTYAIRNYELQGILSPARRTECGYRIYDDQALERLHFIQTGKAAGLPLCELAKFIRAFDKKHQTVCGGETTRLQQLIETKRSAIFRFERICSDFLQVRSESG